MSLKQETVSPLLSLAPMMQKTHKHFRYFIRQIIPNILLYSEMISSEAIIHNPQKRFLDFDEAEHPISLQIGTNSPQHAYQSIKIAEENWNYDEYNLNVGCPSERVQNRNIGASLMAEPNLVCEILQAMREASHNKKPITIKHRIGIESSEIHLTSYDNLASFVSKIEPFVERSTIHARIALLDGLSPKENREIPPLRYQDVYNIQKDFPNLPIEINGHIKTAAEVTEHLKYVKSVMIGRISYEETWQISQFQKEIWKKPFRITQYQLVNNYLHYLEKQPITEKIGLQLFPLLGLFKGMQGAKEWRRNLSPPLPKLPAHQILSRAIEQLPEEAKEI